MIVTDFFSGLPQGAKPPPLTMVNSGASKVTRNTATVQPLSQVSSPSNSVTAMSGNAALNATRTSSFAAALRKLANQAKEPGNCSPPPPPVCPPPPPVLTLCACPQPMLFLLLPCVPACLPASTTVLHPAPKNTIFNNCHLIT